MGWHRAQGRGNQIGSLPQVQFHHGKRKMSASSQPSLTLALRSQHFKGSDPTQDTGGFAAFQNCTRPSLENSSLERILSSCSRVSAGPVPHTSRDTLQHATAKCFAMVDATQKFHPAGTQREKDLPPCSRAIPLSFNSAPFSVWDATDLRRQPTYAQRAHAQA